MKIIELQAENVKRIRAVAIRPDGNVVTISGENGQGKSSVLDSIMYALGGAATHAPEVIRRGEEKAQVVVDLGDIIVKRRWTQGGTSLTVESKDGTVHKSPQGMLDKLVGALSFDPMAFLRLDPKKQADTLKELVGVDTSLIETAHTALFDKRTGVTAKGKELRARFDQMPVPAADVPEQPVSVDQLLNEQAQLQVAKAENEKVRQAARDATTKADNAKTEKSRAAEAVATLSRQLENAREAFAGWETTFDRLAGEAHAQREAAGKLVDPDVAEVVRKISRADATNQAVRVKKERAALEVELKTKRTEKEDLDKKLEQLDSDKRKLLRDAKFPVPGLAFTADGLTLNEIPLEQASSAERLRVSLAMGLALNPKLKVVLIRDGSLLDKKSLQMVAEMAAAADAQVWLEMVGAGGVGVVIEDGHVAAPDDEHVEVGHEQLLSEHQNPWS